MKSLVIKVENCNELYWDKSFENWVLPKNLIEFNFSALGTRNSSNGNITYLPKVFD